MAARRQRNAPAGAQIAKSSSRDWAKSSQNATFAGHVYLGDDQWIRLGDSNEFQIGYDGNNSNGFVDVDTGYLTLDAGTNIWLRTGGSENTLYLAGADQSATFYGDVTLNGPNKPLTIIGDYNIGGDVWVGENVEIAPDAQLYGPIFLGTEVKIKGQDYEFLKWALNESKRRKPINALRRRARQLWQRYADPRKVVNKLRTLVTRPAGSEA